MHDPSDDLKISRYKDVFCSRIVTSPALLSANKDIKRELQATSCCASGLRSSALVGVCLEGWLGPAGHNVVGGWISSISGS